MAKKGNEMYDGLLVIEASDGKALKRKLAKMEVIPERYAVRTSNRCTQIKRYGFEKCVGMEILIVSDSVTEIDDYGIYKCEDLKKIVIGNSVKIIKRDGIMDCENLSDLSVSEDNKVYDSRGNCKAIIETLTNTLIKGCSNTVIPNSVTTIGDSSFMGCKGLNDIKIPNSVTTIGNNAFKGCEKLTSIEIPDSVTTIGASAFSSTSLTEIIIPKSVTKIESSVLWGCRQLTEVNLPDSLTSIGYSTFRFCSGLTSIIIPASVNQIGDDAFYGCTNMISISIPDQVTEIGSYAFSGCESLTKIRIPDQVTTIGADAFSGCGSLTEIHIPDSVMKIERQAFGRCCNLKSIVVSEGNKVYDSRDNCNAIIETSTSKIIRGCENTIIPSSVTAIDEYAFTSAIGLKEINLDSITDIGRDAFEGCTGLTSIKIPKSVTKIEKGTFKSCRGLVEVIIPDSVEFVGDYAFIDSALKSVTVPNPDTIVSKEAFEDHVDVIITKDERLKLKRYIRDLDYYFEEFDMDDYDGSYYDTEGRLSELFDNDQIEEALGEYSKKYLKDTSEEQIKDIICDLVLNLGQGSIKYLEIKDGKKTLYKDSNEQPYTD